MARSLLEVVTDQIIQKYTTLWGEQFSKKIQKLKGHPREIHPKLLMQLGMLSPFLPAIFSARFRVSSTLVASTDRPISLSVQLWDAILLALIPSRRSSLRRVPL